MSVKKNDMNNLFKIAITALVLLHFVNLNAQKTPFKKTLSVNGRIQFDYEFLKRDKSDQWFNANEFRRLQLSVSGKVAPQIKYKVEASFAHASLGFRDVYIKYVAGKWGNFSVGSVAEPTGLEMLTSSKYITLFERAMLSSMQNFKWGSGLHYENFSLLNGTLALQMALTNNGLNNEGFKDVHLEKGNNFIARLTSTPIFDKEKSLLLHMGVNYDLRPAADLKFKPENHMGSKYHYTFPDAKKRSDLGFEWATNYKSASLQGEYKIQQLSNDVNKDYQVAGYYIMGSFFLTGEHRPYKHAAFGRVKPKKELGNGGYGAFELAARYSNMSVSKDVADANPGLPKQVNNISLGLSWYLTAHAKIMYNYVLTDDANQSLGNLKGHLIRAQIDF